MTVARKIDVYKHFEALEQQRQDAVQAEAKAIFQMLKTSFLHPKNYQNNEISPEDERLISALLLVADQQFSKPYRKVDFITEFLTHRYDRLERPPFSRLKVAFKKQLQEQLTWCSGIVAEFDYEAYHKY